MQKARQKEASDSVFTLDDLIQESIEMNNFLKKKMESPIQNTQSLSKFFSRKIKLQNSSKKKFLGKKFFSTNCKLNINNQIRLIV